MPAEHSRPVLYKAWFCPYAQRTYLAMLANGVDFQIKEQDPYDKTPEFLAINPKGLVPVLVHKGKSIVESGEFFDFGQITYCILSICEIFCYSKYI